MSSQPHRNFVLISMDGTIYKYDLVTKQLLFHFKSLSQLECILYDRDDKLLVASENSVRLWDYIDGQEDAELWAIQEFNTEEEKVKRVFVNEHRSTADSGQFLFVVITETHFIIY